MNEIKIYSKFGEEFAPIKADDGSVGYDLVAPYDIILPYGTENMVDTGIVVDVRDYGKPIFTMLVPRSSAGHKKNIRVKTTVGIIDPSYCGPEDSIRASLQRTSLLPRFIGSFPYDEDESPWERTRPSKYGLDVNPRDTICHITKEGEGSMIHFFHRKSENLEDIIPYRKGERFAQLLFLPFESPVPVLVQQSELSQGSRGGFGSTGNK